MTCTSLKQSLLLLSIALAIARTANAGDADIISDFVLPPNTTIVGSNYFTYTRLRGLISGDDPKSLTITRVSMTEFMALNGQSVSYAVMQFPAGSVNPLQTNVRSAGLLFLLYGTLEVGFVDTTNKLYTQTLQSGDMFLFPKGLVHYQYDPDSQKSAFAIAALGSARAGTVYVPTTIFSTGIDETILAKSFDTDVATIEKLKASVVPTA